MAKGRKPDPQRAKRGTGNRPQAGKAKQKIVRQTSDVLIAAAIRDELPEGLPREVFMRAIADLSGKLNDSDYESLKMMAWAIYRHQQLQKHIEDHGVMIETEWGWKANPALAQARLEAALYLKVADQYALTFIARLRAGLMQLAGESMLANLHEGIAGAIVNQITAKEVTK